MTANSYSKHHAVNWAINDKVSVVDLLVEVPVSATCDEILGF